jgi:hypothetical protein
MPADWFRVKKTGTGTEDDPYRPDLDAFTIDGFAGNEDDVTGNTPVMVVKVVADQAVLDDIANASQATRLSSVPKDTFDQLFGQTRTASEWDQAFTIGGV